MKAVHKGVDVVEGHQGQDEIGVAGYREGIEAEWFWCQVDRT